MGTSYHDGGELAKRQGPAPPPGWQDIKFKVDRLACGNTYAAGQCLW